MAWNYYRADVLDGLWAAGNFSLGAIPVDLVTEQVYFPPGVQVAVAGTNQAGVEVGDLRIAPGMRFGVGTSGSPLIISADLLVHEGDGTLYFQDGGDVRYTTHCIINSPNGTLAAYLNGNTITNITVVAGAVTCASTLGSTAKPSRIIVGSAASPYPANVTVDCTMAASGTIFQLSGVITANDDIPLVYQMGGEYYQKLGTGGTIYLKGGRYCYMVPSASGTLTAAYVYPGGVLDCTKVPVPQVITDIYLWPDGTFIRDPDLTVVTNDVTPIGGGGVIRGPDID
ncbi:MAG: hypothetical protein ACYTEQ_29030 [Planctomycetota bacterium]|jgi:hypothetical protein